MIDGSAISCFPIEPLLKKCSVIIGTYVNSINRVKKISGMLNIFDRGLHLALYDDVEQKKEYCDLFVEPPALINYNMFDFKQGRDLVEIGYECAIRQKEKILLLQN